MMQQNNARYLTEVEIADIIEAIPKPVCSDRRKKGLGYDIWQQQKDCVASMLRTKMIVPQGILDLKDQIVKHMNKAVIDPGTAVGTLASQAVSEPATQGKLKNFTSTGTLRSRSYGPNRINELLAVTSNQEFNTGIVIFEDKNIKAEQVLREFRPKIVGMTLKKLVKEYSTISMDDDQFQDMDKTWWSTYIYVFGVNTNALNRLFLRVQLDVEKMATYKITMPMVVKAIKSGNNQKYLEVIHSSFSKGIIDIFVLHGAEVPTKQKNKKVAFDPQDVSTFIENVLIPAVTGDKSHAVKESAEIQISGIKGIEDLTPVDVLISTFVTKVVERGSISAPGEDGRTMETYQVYDLFLNTRQEVLLGITRDRIKGAFKEVGCRFIKVPDTEIHYKSKIGYGNPYLRCLSKNGNPVQLVEQLHKSLEKKLPNDTVVMDYDHPQFNKIVYCYAEVAGNRLRDILSIPGVDKKHTISNSLNEVREILGMQAAYNFIVQELITVIDTLGTRIHPSHVQLIAGAMTRTNVILPVNYIGMNNNVGPYTNMGFERAAETVISAARGESEEISSVSSQIAMGRVPLAGTGAMDVFTDTSDEFPEFSMKLPNLPKVSMPVSVPLPIAKPATTLPPIVPKVSAGTTLLDAVTTTPVVARRALDILKERRKNLNTIIANTPATSKPNEISYTFAEPGTDIPMKDIANRRPDLFALISQVFNTSTPSNPSTGATIVRTIRPRVVIPLIGASSASSLLNM